MAIGDDFAVAANGDIRRTGTGTTNYTVIDLHRWLGGLMDDAEASGDDILDITDATAAERSTDNFITLKAPYNIDDLAAQYLYDGSIVQASGAEIYDGMVVYAKAGAYVTIIQNGAILSPNFWTTGINADSTQGISHRFMVKVRTAGSDIDGRRMIGQTRESTFTYSEFQVAGTGRGNNTIALQYNADLNNTTAAATIKTWTTITNTEGFRALDVDNDTVNENYYSEWNKDTFTINQFYERGKWLTRRATTEASNAETGTNYKSGEATPADLGRSQSFANGVVAQLLTRVHCRLRKVGSPTGNLVAKLYAHSGTFGTSSIPTGAALATSVNIDVSKLITTYKEIEIAFATQYEMAASTNYCIAFEYTGSTSDANHVEIEGAAAGTHGGNLATLVTTVWTASAGADLWFAVYASPKLYGITAERFRGITHEITVDTPTGTFSAVEQVSWSGGVGQMLAINSTTAATKMWIQLLTGVPPTDNQQITGLTSSATVLMNVTITARDLSFPFVGATTGTAIIGAYGLGIETTDLSASDKLFDLTNAQRNPPNNVTFTVAGVVSGEDRVLVTPLGYIIAYDGEAGGPFTDGETLTFSGAGTAKLLVLTDNGTTGYLIVRMLSGNVPADNETFTGGTSSASAVVNGAPEPSVDTEQLTLNGALSGAAVTSVVVTEAIPTDTPSTGTIRIRRANSVESRHPYTAINYGTKTFTITSHDFSTNNAANGAGTYISYIDKLATSTSESFTGVFLATRSLFVKVRDGGGTPIKTFAGTGSLGSAGGSVTAIRTADA